MAQRNFSEMTDDELEALAGGSTPPQTKGMSFNPTTASDAELEAMATGDPDELELYWPKTLGQAGDNALRLAKKAGLLPSDPKKAAQESVEKQAAEMSSFTKGVLRTIGLPFDIANMGYDLLADEEGKVFGVKENRLPGGQELVDLAKKYGLVYEQQHPSAGDRFKQTLIETTSSGAASAAILQKYAQMLQAGKYIPQTVDAAKTVFQRMMTDVANNPALTAMETKAAAGAGTALGVLKAAFPDSPWWADFLATLGGGAASYPGKPWKLSRAGQEEEVSNVLTDLYSPGTTKGGLRSAIEAGEDALTDSAGNPRVENFQPLTGQVAVKDTLLPDGSKARTRPLMPFTQAQHGGTSEMQTALEGQARAINEAAEKAGSGAHATGYPVTPSEGGRAIRENLEAARGRAAQRTSAAYGRVDESAVRPMHELFDEGVKILGQKSEADKVGDMPEDLRRFMDTFREQWPVGTLHPRTSTPISFDDLIALRQEALKTKDPGLLAETDQLLTRLQPEKQLGLLKQWRTRVMTELEDARGVLKNRLTQFKAGIERAIDSFGNPPPGASPGQQGEAAAFREASRLNRELKSTYDEGPVGQALDKERGRNVTGDSDVGPLFTSPSKQPESWNALVAAAGDPSKATQMARRLIQQRFHGATTNQPLTPEGVRPPSSSKMRGFLDNPDNKELLVNAYGQGHYDRLKELEEFARLRESLLTSPGIGGSNTKEKLKALEKLQGGRELDKFFSSMTLRLGFAARAGRKGTELLYNKANTAMEDLYSKALIDPTFLKGLLDKAGSAEALRARTRLYSFFGPEFSKLPREERADWENRSDKPGYAKGGKVVDLSDLKDADMLAQAAIPGFAKGGPAKWFSSLEHFLENKVDAGLKLPVEKWREFLAGRPGVKREELEIVWPSVEGSGYQNLSRDQVLDLVKGSSHLTDLPEFQSRDPLKLQDLKKGPNEPSPLRMLSGVTRSTPDSAIPFEIGHFPDGRDAVYSELFPQWTTITQGSWERELADKYNREFGTKYPETSRVRLPGGTNYRETVIGSPLAEPMSIDSAHFGSVPGVGDKQVSWALHHSRLEPGLEGDYGVPPEVMKAIEPAPGGRTLFDQGRQQVLGDVRHLANQEEPLPGLAIFDELTETQRANLPETPEALMDMARAGDLTPGDLGAVEVVEPRIARQLERLNRAAPARAEAPNMAQHPRLIDARIRERGYFTDEDVIQANMPYTRQTEAEFRQEWANMDEADRQYYRDEVQRAHPNHPWAATEEFEPEEVMAFEPDEDQIRRAMVGYDARREPQELVPGTGIMNPFMNQEMDQTFPNAEVARSYWVGAGVPVEQVDRAIDRFLQTYAPQRVTMRGQPGQQAAAKALPAPALKKPTGAKVTFIDELQSYRHQRGRQTGYKGEAQTQVKAARDAIIDELARRGVSNLDSIPNDPWDFQRAAERYGMGIDDPLMKKYREVQDKFMRSGYNLTPDAPYKKSWPLLTFRRMLWQAAEDGSDWLAWNTAEGVMKHGTGQDIASALYDKELPTIAKEEAKRLGLGKDQVKQIQVGPKPNRTTALQDSDIQLVNKAIDDELGPESATAMEELMMRDAMARNRLTDAMNLSSQEEGVYSNLANEFRKAYKVLDAAESDEEVDRTFDNYLNALNNLQEFIGRYKHKWEARPQPTAWGLRLTPEIREKILKEGLPKFVGAGLAAGEAEQFLQDHE